MISQFSKELSEVLAFSREEADRLSCPSVAPEHLLLAVFRLSDPKIQRVISTLSLDVPTVKKELEQYASSNKEESKRIYEEINVTDRAANVLHLAVLEARIQHRKIVDVEDLILAILHDQTDTGAKMTLQAHHLDYIEANALLRQLANDVQGGLDLSDDDDDDMLFNDDEEEDREEARSQGGGAQQTLGPASGFRWIWRRSATSTPYRSILRMKRFRWITRRACTAIRVAARGISKRNRKSAAIRWKPARTAPPGSCCMRYPARAAMPISHFRSTSGRAMFA